MALIGAHGVGPAHGARHPVGPRAGGAGPHPGRRRRRRPVPGAGRRQEDGGPPADRAQGPAPHPALRGRAGHHRRRRPTATATPRRPTRTCARRWPGSATRPTRCGWPPPSCPTTATPPRCCARRSAGWPRGPDRGAGGAARPRARSPRMRRPSAACGPGGWRSSWARPSSRPTSRSCSRPPAAGARRPTTCSSPARRAWARPRWPPSSPPRSTPTSTPRRARHRAGRRPGRHPHPARRGRRAVRRRDPPPAPPGRGGALPGDGGLPARHRAGQGAGGPVHPPRPAPVHAGGGHHPHRARSPARCATGSGWWPGSTTTRADDLEAIVGRTAVDPRRRHRRRGLRRGRPPGPGHAADRQPPAPPGARLRRGAGHRPGRPRRSPRPAWRSSASTTGASTRSTGRSSTPCAGASAAGRWACRRSPSAWASRPRRWRTSTSRSSSSRGCSCARRGAGSPLPAAWHHLGVVPPPDAGPARRGAVAVRRLTPA